MPELPEVETVKITLKNLVEGKTISDVDIYWDNIISYPDTYNFIENLKGQTINDIKRRGKFLIFILDDYGLVSHLRMEGKYFLRKDFEEINKHEHVIFRFKDNTELRYHDTRKFGKMHLHTLDDVFKTKPLIDLGLEPWDENLTREYLSNKFKNKSIPIKTTLLDQSILTGIGNIYVNEILFLSKINPTRKTNLISDNEIDLIIEHTKDVLEKAILSGGTTIRSYTSSEGVTGRFQQELYVHTKEGETCVNCGTTILKMKVGGRGTYYCPKCQDK